MTRPTDRQVSQIILQVMMEYERRGMTCRCGTPIGDSIDERWHLANQVGKAVQMIGAALERELVVLDYDESGNEVVGFVDTPAPQVPDLAKALRESFERVRQERVKAVPHLHRERVPGCFRCDLAAEETGQ